MVRLQINQQLDQVLRHVPKDHWIDYKVTPTGDLYLTDQQPVPVQSLPSCMYWDYVADIRKRMEAGEEEPVLESHRLAVSIDIQAGDYIPRDIRQAVGL